MGWAGGCICSYCCIEQQPSITQKGNWARKKLIENMGGEGSVYEGVNKVFFLNLNAYFVVDISKFCKERRKHGEENGMSSIKGRLSFFPEIQL